MNEQLMFTFSGNTELPRDNDKGAWYHLFNSRYKYILDPDDIVSIDKIEYDGDSVFVYATFSFVCE